MKKIQKTMFQHFQHTRQQQNTDFFVSQCVYKITAELQKGMKEPYPGSKCTVPGNWCCTVLFPVSYFHRQTISATKKMHESSEISGVPVGLWIVFSSSSSVAFGDVSLS